MCDLSSLGTYILTYPYPAVTAELTACEGSAGSSSFRAGCRAGDMQKIPLLAGNATNHLLCYSLGSKSGEIVEWLYFFSEKIHLCAVPTLKLNSGKERKSVHSLFVCPAKSGQLYSDIHD